MEISFKSTTSKTRVTIETLGPTTIITQEREGAEPIEIRLTLEERETLSRILKDIL